MEVISSAKSLSAETISANLSLTFYRDLIIVLFLRPFALMKTVMSNVASPNLSSIFYLTVLDVLVGFSMLDRLFWAALTITSGFWWEPRADLAGSCPETR